MVVEETVGGLAEGQEVVRMSGEIFGWIWWWPVGTPTSSSRGMILGS